MKKFELKEYHYLFIIGFLLAFFALIEKRIRLFYIFSAIVFAMALFGWLIDERKKIKIGGRKK